MPDGMKSVIVLVAVVAGFAALVILIDKNPSPTVWWIGIGCVGLTVVCVGLLFVPTRKRVDLAPDYLFKVFLADVCQKEDCCFFFRMRTHDNICWLEVFFQNQRERPCSAKIALSPLTQSFRTKVETIAVQIGVGPAAFGVARVPVPLPAKAQGTVWTFNIGASVSYPNGAGKLMRHRKGVAIKGSANFPGGFAVAKFLASAAVGDVGYSSPTRIDVEIPQGVLEQIPDGVEPVVETLWQLGDPERTPRELMRGRF